ncbi:hypoxanthine phosphoribosyltransferase [Hutsoniella sourekii]
MESFIEEVLLSKEALQQRIQELGQELTQEYAGKRPLLVCVLKGGMPFMAALMQEIVTELSIDFMAVSSYGNQTQSSGEVEILKDLSQPVTGRHVLFVEDIVDTGLTLKYLYNLMDSRDAASVKTVCLLDKPARRSPQHQGVQPDWVGFEIPDEFVVGFGLDYQERYRNLPYIGVLKHEIYE